MIILCSINLSVSVHYKAFAEVVELELDLMFAKYGKVFIFSEMYYCFQEVCLSN